MRDVAVVITAAVLPLVLHPSRSLHFDEAFAAHVAGLPWTGWLAFLVRHDAHPPLFYALLKAWTAVLGDSAVALRGLSAVCGGGAVAATIRLGRAALRGQAGMVAGAILAVSPLYLYTAAEARMYPLLVALFALAAAEVLTLWNRNAGFPWLLALALTGLLYTHYLGVGLVAALAAGALWSGGRAALARYAAALAVAGAAFLPWVPILLGHVADGRMTPPWRGSLPPDAILGVVHLIGFGGRTLGAGGYYFLASASLPMQVLLAAPVVALLALGAATSARANEVFFRLATAAVGIPAAALFAASLWTGSFVAYPRYFSFAMPFVAVALASVVASGVTARRLPGAVLAGLFGVVLALSLGSLADFSARPTRGAGDWKAAAAFLESRIRPGDVVAVYPRHTEVPLGYYLPGDRAAWVVLPTDRQDPRATEAAEATDRLAVAFDRVWLVTRWPIPPGGFEATLRRASRTHRVAEFGDFEDVRITLFTRR
ncbi:MAG: glycosyltransferase family 39 protein [Armatimonadota bacterium]|nr:glycosyltransferase family 39 protein [Armatimonadota bacterium]